MYAVPLTVLTGFLGAGKTTLLNRILTGDHGLRVAVLVNDFGSINIDAELIVGIEGGGEVVSLANGCICCTIRDDLIATVLETIDRPEQPEYILLEASGVAEPSAIWLSFTSDAFRDRIRMDSILCVVDAEQVFAGPEQMELKLRQMAFADLIVLNKVDLVSRDEVARIRAWLDDRFHRYRLIEARRGDVPLELLLAVGRFDPGRCGPCRPDDHAHDHAHDHGSTFSSWSFETDRPLSLEALEAAARRLPATVYRAKGVIHSADRPDRRSVLQVVGKRVEITAGDRWNGQTPRTRIVVIGAAGGVDAALLHDRLEQTLAAGASA